MQDTAQSCSMMYIVSRSSNDFTSRTTDATAQPILHFRCFLLNFPLELVKYVVSTLLLHIYQS